MESLGIARISARNPHTEPWSANHGEIPYQSYGTASISDIDGNPHGGYRGFLRGLRHACETMKAYAQGFYASRHEDTRKAAETILSVVLEHIPEVHSAVDLGCGVGTWLSVLHKRGVKVVQGMDGSWVDTSLLAIPSESFTHIDLSTETISLPQRYDLAISVEVAEHLPAERAKSFVASLTSLSDHVLFSAAIPLQGGRNHINEQWQSYWAALFAELGYVARDVVRPRIWSDSKIAFWYRQNILLYSKKSVLKESPVQTDQPTQPGLLDIVHPDFYLRKVNAQVGLSSILRVTRRTLRHFVGRLFGKGG